MKSIVKYKSPLEGRVHKKLPSYEYEAEKLPYIIKRKYIPDFIDRKRKIIIECKGFFRDGDDRKYAAIREAYPEYRLVFVFTDLNKPVRRASKRRKDGTKLSLGEWATQNGWEAYTEYTLPKDLK